MSMPDEWRTGTNRVYIDCPLCGSGQYYVGAVDSNGRAILRVECAVCRLASPAGMTAAEALGHAESLANVVIKARELSKALQEL